LALAICQSLEADATHPEDQIPEFTSALCAWMGRTRPAQDADQRPTTTQERPREADNLLHAIWDLLDPNLQDAFSLAYNKKRRERGPGPTRISTRDLFQALARIDDGTLQRLLADLPQEAMPLPIDETVQKDRTVLEEEPLLSDCIAESLASFRRVTRPDRKVTSTDLFVDISKHGHGPSVSQLREHGVGPEEIDKEVDALGVEVLKAR
jgi:hypothetical protein